MKQMSNENRKLVILGAGESGVGAAVLAKKQGWDVFVSDFGKIEQAHKKTLQRIGVDFEEGHHTQERILAANEVVKSPGIADDVPVVLKIREQGIKVISEIEFASRYTHARKICVTGSNGKTTTTLMTYHILKRSGLNVGLAGNVGQSLARQVAEHNYDYYVLEVSSFQLDGMYEFKADVAVLLNITPDHLDRYQNNFQKYVDSKFRIVQNLTKDDYVVYSSDDEVLLQELKNRILEAGVLPFSVKQQVEEGGYLENDILHIKVNDDEFTIPTRELPLKGMHNVYNSLAASISSKLMDIRNEDIRESLRTFQGVEHRLEQVAYVHGIEFINDSKATNINAAWYALESMALPTVWIVGGVDKGNDYSMLNELVDTKVKSIVCLGTDNSKLLDTYRDTKHMVEAHSMQEAVESAYELADEGDTVLLSPACASFDLFKNYEDRGRQFKQAVNAL